MSHDAVFGPMGLVTDLMKLHVMIGATMQLTEQICDLYDDEWVDLVATGFADELRVMEAGLAAHLQSFITEEDVQLALQLIRDQDQDGSR